jgi:hypothetical protein
VIHWQLPSHLRGLHRKRTILLANYPSIHSSIVKEPFPELLNHREWYRTPLLQAQGEGCLPRRPQAHIYARSFYIPRDKVEPSPELLELVSDGYIEVRDAEQLDPAKPVQEHQLCLAGAGFVNLSRLDGTYCRTPPSAAHIPGPPDLGARSFPPPPLRSVCREGSIPAHQLTGVDPRAAACCRDTDGGSSAANIKAGAQLSERSIDKTQEQNQLTLILRNQRRGYQLIPLPGHGAGGSSRGELADGTGMGRIVIVGGGGSAQADESNPTVAVDGQAPHLAPSRETNPTPDPSHRIGRQTTTVAQP